jgi:hypothetical protein
MVYDAARQRVVLFGGNQVVSGTNDTWEWDGSAWTQVADMGPSPRWSFGMTYDAFRQRLVLFGGFVPPLTGAAATVGGDTWERVGSEWTQVADTGPAPRQLCTLTYDPAGQRVVLFGGFSQADEGFNDTWEWDGSEWTQIADTGPSARFSPAMVFDRSRPGSECLVLFGGFDTMASRWLTDTWEFFAGTGPGPDTGWVKRQDMGPPPIAHPRMVYTEQHTVLFGSSDPVPSSVAAGQTWELDRVSRLWTQRQDMGPGVRAGHGLADDSLRDRMVLFGGFSLQSFQNFGDTWELEIIEPVTEPASKDTGPE